MHEWIDRYLQTLENANTLSAYRNDLTQFVDFLARCKGPAIAGVQRLGDATPAHFQEFRFFLQARGYAEATIARKLASIRTFYRFLTDQGEAQEEAVKALGQQIVKRPEPDFLTLEEIEDLLGAPERQPSRSRPRDKAMLELLYHTGLRVSALLRLNKSDVTPDRTRIRAPAQGADFIALPARAQQALAAYLDSNDRPRKPARDPEALFVNHQGQRLTRQGLWIVLKQYLPHTQIQRAVTLEMIRHSHTAHTRPHPKRKRDARAAARTEAAAETNDA